MALVLSLGVVGSLGKLARLGGLSVCVLRGLFAKASVNPVAAQVASRERLYFLGGGGDAWRFWVCAIFAAVHGWAT